jgi:hypothetical protein
MWLLFINALHYFINLFLICKYLNWNSIIKPALSRFCVNLWCGGVVDSRSRLVDSSIRRFVDSSSRRLINKSNRLTSYYTNRPIREFTYPLCEFTNLPTNQLTNRPHQRSTQFGSSPLNHRPKNNRHGGTRKKGKKWDGSRFSVFLSLGWLADKCPWVLGLPWEQHA